MTPEEAKEYWRTGNCEALKGTMNNNTTLCPDCARAVSRRARKCPQCGHPFQHADAVIFAIIGAVIIGVIVLALMGVH